ncbi:MAG TPA: hypothetical protein VNV82_06955 [Bryobacteraceae bacterium]|nr:hypothetical protein [Bryobacteraceae bacterium]
MSTCRQVPTDRDGANAKKGRDGGNRQPLKFIHDDDGPAARRQNIQRLPNGCPGNQHRFGVSAVTRKAAASQYCFIVAVANGSLAPLVTANVDEHPY